MPHSVGLGLALGSWKFGVPRNGEGGGTFKQELTWLARSPGCVEAVTRSQSGASVLLFFHVFFFFFSKSNAEINFSACVKVNASTVTSC